MSSPEFLLSHPQLVAPAAPWCRRCDNLELGILLLTQPMVGAGRRCADLERQLNHLSAELPFGPVYFQRIKRAVARLEENGALAGSGATRARSYTLTPRGFAALILNLQVLQVDPSLDGREFELKRALVSMWGLLRRELSPLPEKGDGAAEHLDSFFEEAERLTLFGQPVLSPEVVAAAVDPLRLIGAARRRVEEALASTRQSLAAAEEASSELRRIDLSELVGAATRTLAGGALRQLELAARVRRHEHYTSYLDSLAALSVSELPVVEPGSLRQVMSRG